jgi:hypothetical protein
VALAPAPPNGNAEAAHQIDLVVRVEREGHHAVDVVLRQARVAHGRERGFRGQLQLAAAGVLRKFGLADADDGRTIDR